MRAAPFISESAQWQTTSWTDHLSGRGRHRTASSGTTASASRMRSGPRSYCTMRSSRSAALKNMAPPCTGCGALRTLEPTPGPGAPGRSGARGALRGGDCGVQGGAELAHRHRLAQHRADSELGLLAGFEHEIAAEDHGRHPVAFAAQQAQELPAGEPGHLFGEEPGIERALGAVEDQRLQAVHGGFDVEALVDEAFDQYLAEQRLVLGQEDARHLGEQRRPPGSRNDATRPSAKPPTTRDSRVAGARRRSLFDAFARFFDDFIVAFYLYTLSVPRRRHGGPLFAPRTAVWAASAGGGGGEDRKSVV